MTNSNNPDTEAPEGTFMLTIPLHQVEQAQRSLKQAGVDFQPRNTLFVIDLERELIFHGADSVETVLPPINFAQDIPDLVPAINKHLQERGLHPLLPVNVADWNIQQELELLNLATMDILWVGFRPVVSDNFPQSQKAWQEYAAQHPALFGTA